MQGGVENAEIPDVYPLCNDDAFVDMMSPKRDRKRAIPDKEVIEISLMNEDGCVPNVVARRSLASSQPDSEMSSTFSNKCHVRSKKSRRGKATGSADIGGTKDGCKNIQQKASKKQQLHVVANTLCAQFVLYTMTIVINNGEIATRERMLSLMQLDYVQAEICVPLNWKGSHWYLAVVDQKARQVLIYDSFSDLEYDKMRLIHADIVCGRIQGQGGLSVGFGYNSPHNIRSYEFICSDWCPQQINSFDCGIYVMKHMEIIEELQDGCSITVMNENIY
ncbi:hypothetical protein ACH5RR_032160 [Cinchona calisaya]|uniref:Ubiquitin-like protease family profile domain-containing protein n=1 Tax=Cinchona calisaya TaxID=153742 RepID=A0ABD2YMK7_9GENT